MKDIKGFEGIYAIITCGRVWSYKRKMFLKPEILCNGYERVSLCRDGIVKRFRVHRLVAETYIPNDSNVSDVNHIDGIKTHNFVSNLEWLSRKDNIIHYIKSLKGN